MELSNNKTIIFKIGEENNPVVYGKDNYKDSMFGEQLETFLSHIKRKLGQRIEDNETFNDVYDNNIIAFIGERGSGKTSCMYSGIQILKDFQNSSSHHGQGKECHFDKEMNFLKVIDPSFFDIQHNILEILIGEMYSVACSSFEKDCGTYGDNKHRLIQQFQETKRHLRFLSSKNNYSNDDDELEELQYLSSGVKLRDSIKKLVHKYLEVTGGEMLVISIDDIDLNTMQAYRMVEQIRKYLILPNVIILMAVKLDQLGNVIRLELTKQFKDVMNNDDDQLSTSDISEMAERYLNKLIPIQSRIYLPRPSTFFERPVRIVGKDEKNYIMYDSIKEAVPALIFAKSRFLFYNTQGTTSLIVPRNLRDLRMLIRMLYVMKDYDKQDITGDSYGNKQQFKQYLFGAWLDDMDIKYKSIANALIKETEPTLFNKKVLDLLKQNRILSEVQTDAMAADILNSSNIAFNISVGDTFYVLKQVEETNTSDELRKLLFFIKTLYSIRLYELYDEMTETPLQRTKKDEQDEKPYRGEELEHISNYGKIVAGGLFTLSGETFLPKEGGTQEREFRNIQGKKLMALIKEVVDSYNSRNVEEKATLLSNEDYAAKLNTVEFFMLTISRYIWTVENNLVESGIHKFRLQPTAYYDRHFDSGTESLLFDVTAPFFTLVDIKHSYDRFHDELYDIATKCEGSLLNKINKLKEVNGRSLSSMSCIRNSEVIDDFFTKMKKKRGQYRKNDNAYIIQTCFKNIGEYKICTYDKRPQEESDMGERYYKITFPVFTEFAKLFESDKFNEMFCDIYDLPKENLLFLFIEKEFWKLWTVNKSMKGSTIQNRMKNSYPELFKAIGDAELDILFEKDKTYRRNNAIQQLADFLNENPTISIALNLGMMQEGNNPLQHEQGNEPFGQDEPEEPAGKNDNITQGENND